MSKKTWVKVEGEWKEVKNVWVRINSSWKDKAIPFIKVDGVLKEVIEYPPEVIEGDYDWNNIYIGESLEVIIPEEIRNESVVSYEKMFQNSEVYYVEAPYSKNVNNMKSMFLGSKAENLSVSDLNTKNVKDVSYMFSDSKSVSLDLTSFDTSNFTNTDYMFKNSSATTGHARTLNDANVFNNSLEKPSALSFGVKSKQDLFLDWSSDSSEGYEVPTEGTIGYYAYYGNENSVHIPHSVDGNPLTSAYAMFEETTSQIKEITNYNWLIEDMSWLFYEATITELNIGKFNTESVKNMQGMFYRTDLDELDLSSFNTKKVENMAYMFALMSVYEINLSSFDTPNLKNTEEMFAHFRCEELDLSSFDMSNVENTNNMFFESNIGTGYARTQEDADILNSSSGKPFSLNFIVK